MRKMKDSGIAWIGEIPAEWKVARIKHHFRVISGATPKSENQVYWDGDIPWVTPADYKTQDKFVSHGIRYLTREGYDSCATTLVPAESIIFSKRAPVGTVAVARNELCTNQGCLSCVGNDNVDMIFYYYVMSACTEQFELVSTGTTFKEISLSAFSNFVLPSPPLDEQRRIAAFLDDKCAHIDAVIEKTRVSIDEYKKLKQAVITRAVTKGIRQGRKMKDSGIEWIGEIPEEWSITIIGRIFFIKAGGDAKADLYSYKQDTEHPYPVYTNALDENQVYAYTSTPFFNDTSITVTGRGAIGHAIYRQTKFDAIIRLLVLSPKIKLDGRFYAYWIDNVIPFFTDNAVIGQLSTQQIYPYKVCHLPLPEQQEIASYLDAKTAAIDRLIAKKEQLVAEMESCKKSLIYEVVTGKREVPIELSHKIQ